MIHVVTGENRHQYKTELKEMHELRRVHFVEERGWADMTVRGRGEFDASDDDRAIYFLALDEQGHVAVSMRARPTDDRCIIADVFPQLIEPDAGDVRGSDIWEISRIFATRANRCRRGILRRNEVLLACMEAAVAAGVTRLVAMIDTYLMPQAQRYPWDMRPLGLPCTYPEGEVIAFGVPVNRGELATVRRELGVRGSVIVPAPVDTNAFSPHEMESLIRAGRLKPDDLALVRRAIAFANSGETATAEQLAAYIELQRERRTGSATLH